MRNYWVWSIVLGIIIVIVAVVEWFGHITLPHAVAILTGIVGLSVALGGLGSRGSGVA
jgi:uncharacterized membrane protein YhaH (DUF805 family)